MLELEETQPRSSAADGSRTKTCQKHWCGHSDCCGFVCFIWKGILELSGPEAAGRDHLSQ